MFLQNLEESIKSFCKVQTSPEKVFAEFREIQKSLAIFFLKKFRGNFPMNRLRIRGLPMAESILHTRRTILLRSVQRTSELRRMRTLSSLPYTKNEEFNAPVSPRGSSITCKASRERILQVCE